MFSSLKVLFELNDIIHLTDVFYKTGYKICLRFKPEKSFYNIIGYNYPSSLARRMEKFYKHRTCKLF